MTIQRYWLVLVFLRLYLQRTAVLLLIIFQYISLVRHVWCLHILNVEVVVERLCLLQSPYSLTHSRRASTILPLVHVNFSLKMCWSIVRRIPRTIFSPASVLVLFGLRFVCCFLHLFIFPLLECPF